MRKALFNAVIAAFVIAVAGFWMFEFGWPFIPFPLLAGVLMALVKINSAPIVIFRDYL